MQNYRAPWIGAVATCATVGVLTALLMLPAGVLATFAVGGALAGIVVRQAIADNATLPRTLDAATVASIGVGACLAVGGIGFLALDPVSGVLLIVLLTLLSPQVLDWLAGLGAGTDTGAEMRPGPRPDPTWIGQHMAPATMSDHHLCRAWRATFMAIQRSRDPAETDILASIRAQYLLEIERRDPAGFAAWLAGGARAASDPARYIHPVEDGPQDQRRPDTGSAAS